MKVAVKKCFVAMQPLAHKIGQCTYIGQWGVFKKIQAVFVG
mgnify:CR=1 FL=1